MARRSLRPQLNQIRAWVRQGRTDAWIAHQLEVSGSELREFRRQHDLTADDETGTGEIDLRDEIEAEIEAATEEEAEAEAESGDDDDEDEGPEGSDTSEGEDSSDSSPEGGDADGDAQPRRRRRRGRRGGRGRRRTELEATFDHGDSDGYGVWLDPSVKDNSNYSEHWAGHRAVTVTVEPDQIIIRRAGDSSGSRGDGED